MVHRSPPLVRCLAIAPTLVAILTGSAAADPLKEAVQRELPALVRVYEHLHSHPELSFQERQTAGYLASALRRMGFTVTERIGRYRDKKLTSHGYVAILNNGNGPTVLLRTDLDALPVQEETGLPYASKVEVTDSEGKRVGVMHACGHDVHMTVQLGAARLLALRRDEWQGTLMLVGQPAEERGAGSRAMLDAGLYRRFGRPDYALALHVAADLPAGQIGYRAGFALANVDSVDITVRGRGGHGAYPHMTLDPVVIAARIVVALQTLASREVAPIDPAVVTVGSIHGGTKHNVIPDEVKLQLTVRSYKEQVRKQLLDGIRRISREVARSAGVAAKLLPTVRLRDEFTPATYNDPTLVDRLVPVLRGVLGEDRVVPRDPVLGGEDFGRFADKGKIPIAMFWLGAVDSKVHRRHQRKGRPLPSLHSSLFAPKPRPAIATGIIALVQSVMELAPAPRLQSIEPLP